MQNLPQLRKQVDRVDDCVVALLNHRLQLARRIGEVKARNGDKIYDRRREQTLLRRLCRLKVGPLSGRELRSIYERILQASRNHQRRVLRSVNHQP
ncbi:MAG: chorismate mutase [Verrucomicrobia bacterium]|nr:chorismate mutase [Verrucomicrobiota bacterium]